MREQRTIFRRAKRIGAGLGLTLLILGGSIGYNYAKYFWPTTALPEAWLDAGIEGQPPAPGRGLPRQRW